MKHTFLWCFLLAKPFYYFGENLFPCVERPDGQNTHPPPHTHPTPPLPAVSILPFFSLDSAPGLGGPSGRGLGLLPILVALIFSGLTLMVFRIVSGSCACGNTREAHSPTRVLEAQWPSTHRPPGGPLAAAASPCPSRSRGALPCLPSGR